MAISTYTVTDTINDQTVTGQIDDIWETVESWFELELPAFETEHGDTVTVGDQLNDLRNALNIHGFTAGLEEALSLKVE